MAFLGPIMAFVSSFFVVMQGNTTTKRQKFRKGSSVPTKKCVIKGAPPGGN